MSMFEIVLVFTCLANTGHGRRLQNSEAKPMQERMEVMNTKPMSLVEVSAMGSDTNAAGFDLATAIHHFDELLDERSDPVSIEQELAALCQEGGPGYESAELQWRLALARVHVADTKPEDAVFREASLRDGLLAAERALEADTECGMAHKLKALTLGLLDPYVGTSIRIENGHIIKKHSDIAASKLPNDAEVQCLLCGFCMGVAGLSWFERTFGSVVFGALPEATYEEALGYGLRACEIMEANDRKGDTKNGLIVRAVLDVAKCYEALGQKKEAKEWYEKTLNTTVRSEIDRTQQREAKDKLERGL